MDWASMDLSMQTSHRLSSWWRSITHLDRHIWTWCWFHPDIGSSREFALAELRCIFPADHTVMIDMGLRWSEREFQCRLRRVLPIVQLNLLFGSVQIVPFHSGRQLHRNPFSRSMHVPLFAHGYDAHSSSSNQTNVQLRVWGLSDRLPCSQLGPAKPRSHWQVNELDALGIQVPCLLHTSGVQTT